MNELENLIERVFAQGTTLQNGVELRDEINPLANYETIVLEL